MVTSIIYFAVAILMCWILTRNDHNNELEYPMVALASIAWPLTTAIYVYYCIKDYVENR